MSKKRIGVLTSGGDCPGLNAVLWGITRAADKLNWEVVGFQDGFEGLLSPGDYTVLEHAVTAGIMHLGGTILGTTSRGHFAAKVGGGTRAQIPAEIIGQARRTMDDLNLHALIVIGGDGSLSTALQLYEAGFPVIGVPKTIDNDLEATTVTFGFDSAIACVTDALDRLHTTATSHRRVMVLEVMGHHTGWIALYGGLAGGADVILIPEIPFDLDNIAKEVLRREQRGCKNTMIVVAEGAVPKAGRQIRQEVYGGESRLGGIGEYVGRELIRRTSKEVRTCVLGHLQRGGEPTCLDRILGTCFGVKAVQLAKEEKFGQMVSYLNEEIRDVPIAHAVYNLRKVDPQSQLVLTARAVEITFGD